MSLLQEFSKFVETHPKISPEEKAPFLERIKKERSDSAILVSQLRKNPSPETRQLALHRIADEKLSSYGSEPYSGWDQVRCGSCSQCCSLRVGVTEDEAVLLVERARELKGSLDLDRLFKQNQCITDSEFMALSVQDRRCVFLSDEGACRAYLVRPIACRKFFSADQNAPEVCATKTPQDLFVHIPLEALSEAVRSGTRIQHLDQAVLSGIAERAPEGE